MTNIKVKEHKTVSTAHNEDYRILIRSVSEQFEHTDPKMVTPKTKISEIQRIMHKSPRKPIVCRLKRSSAWRIFDVA